jgi:AcrR family transcriptional regulator
MVKNAIPSVTPDPGARNHILKVATELFGEKGLDGTTTRDIAKAAGLNISLISYYFGGKTGLYRAIIFEHAKGMQDEIENLLKDFDDRTYTPENFKAQIKSIVKTMVEMRLHSGAMAKIFMSERIHKMPYAKEVFESLMAPTAEKVEALILAGQRKGFIKSGFPPGVFLLCLTEAIFGYFMVQECGLSLLKEAYQLPRDKDLFIDFVSETFTQGILK